jgi:hypothetical protein
MSHVDPTEETSQDLKISFRIVVLPRQPISSSILRRS